MSEVSRRGRQLVAEASPLVTAHMRAVADPYHPDSNPNGYINFGTAENDLVWDLLADRLRGPRERVASDVKYHPLYGMSRFREAVANFLGWTHDATVDPEDLVVASGVSAALDILAYVLCEPGDGIVVPAPYYTGFDVDLAGRAGARIIPAQQSGERDFRLDVDSLESAIVDARADGVSLRAILLASPGNPVGQVLDTATLTAVAELAGRYSLHLVVDEIYACSVFGAGRFDSALTLATDALPSERIHVVWGFAKDFGLSGLKAGVLHTRSPEVRAAARELAYLSPVSTDTQLLLRDLVSDRAWVEAYLEEYRERLGDAYKLAGAALREHGVGHVDATAGVFQWLDLRPWLAAPTWDAERALWRRVFDQARVSISPGAAFHGSEPGWFRLCYATNPVTVREGIARIGTALSRS